MKRAFEISKTGHGWCLEDVCSRYEKRIEVLLLIATLANLAMQLIGIVGETMGLHYQFQANTIRNRRVLSYFVLAKRLIATKTKIPMRYLLLAIIDLRDSLKESKT